MVNARGSAVVIAFDRSEELTATLSAIARSDTSSLNQLIIVLQPGNKKVEQICKKIDWIKCTILVSDAIKGAPMVRINGNVFKGLEYAFSNPDNDWVAMIEDDIVIAPDFFRFSSFIVSKYEKEENFFGVNGFSGIKRRGFSDGDFGKYRYGLGWGWVITKNSWERLSKIWTGKEKIHWDVHIEHFIKTGFVIMPIQSRILNIGFNEKATHTKNECGEMDSKSAKIQSSFVAHNYKGSYHEVSRDLEWRRDCRQYLSDPKPLAQATNTLYNLNSKVQYPKKTTFASVNIKNIWIRINEVLLDFLYFLAKFFS